MDKLIVFLEDYDLKDYCKNTYTEDQLTEIASILDGNIKENYTDHVLLYYAGIVSRINEDYELAIEYFTNSIAVSNNLIALCNLGDIYFF